MVLVSVQGCVPLDQADANRLQPGHDQGRLEPLFACDEMLARLARLLRAAGHDALLADVGMPDAALLAVARTEGRVLLTRDRRLASTAGVQVVLIEADAPEEQAAELARAYPVDWLRAPLTRCLIDNAALRPATSQEIEQAPAFARDLVGDFTTCLSCGRLYWPGSHARRIMDKLRALAARGAADAEVARSSA